ncbi:MAG: hypothetical protein Fur005_16440 [Roseiflexaceae bacterium]
MNQQPFNIILWVVLGAIVACGIMSIFWRRTSTRLRAEADRRAKLFRAAQQIGDSLDMEALYLAIHRSVEQMMPCDAICISLLHPDEQLLEDAYLVDREGRWPGTRYPMGSGIVSYTIMSGRSLRIDDFTEDWVLKTGAQFFGNTETRVRSVLMVLMRRGSRVVGVLSAQARRPNAYSDADLETLELLSANAAIAIEHARLFEKTRQLAISDSLTGAFNRRHFFDVAEYEWNAALNNGHAISAMMIDVDHFKRINDTHGHMIGDDVLRAMVSTCRQTIRSSDIIGRYGGEEFAVLLPRTATHEAYQVAERLRQAIAAIQIETTTAPIQVTVSIGVASNADARPGGLLDHLLDAADQALYTAKREGRNRVCISTISAQAINE